MKRIDYDELRNGKEIIIKREKELTEEGVVKIKGGKELPFSGKHWNIKGEGIFMQVM